MNGGCGWSVNTSNPEGYSPTRKMVPAHLPTPACPREIHRPVLPFLVLPGPANLFPALDSCPFSLTLCCHCLALWAAVGSPGLLTPPQPVQHRRTSVHTHTTWLLPHNSCRTGPSFPLLRRVSSLTGTLSVLSSVHSRPRCASSPPRRDSPLPPPPLHLHGSMRPQAHLSAPSPL